MADRRMFSKGVIISDAFLMMTPTAQNLYFYLNMMADDDGFLNNAKMIIRMVGASNDDFALLVENDFVIEFDKGVCAIKHWKANNYIRSDRYKPTIYQKELSSLTLSDEKGYETKKEDTEQTSSEDCSEKQLSEENLCKNSGIPTVDQCETQVRLGKDRLDKDSIGKSSVVQFSKEQAGEDNNFTEDAISEACMDKEYSKEEYKKFMKQAIKKWNSLKLSSVVKINNQRLNVFKKLMNEYGFEMVMQALDNINKSSFLKGANNNKWRITFDWFLDSANFIKVLEGNYEDKNYEDENVINSQSFDNFEPREYDYEDLEKKLLGWG